MLPIAGQLGVPVHLHTAFPANRWPLLSIVTSAMSWLTLRRDRPNRSAMARWLQRRTRRDRHRAGRADRLLHIARHLWHAGGRMWPARAAHELYDDFDRGAERDCGPGRDQAPPACERGK
jgi:hypothetical protein